MNNNSTLPAVIMALSAIGSLPTASPVRAASGAATVRPIVAMHTATNDATAPARLDTWASDLAAATAMPQLRDEPPLGRCGTISGSGFGWDDSRQDC